jgi:hypothetical protein
VKSFLIADLVFRQDNGKYCIIGIFDHISSRRFPVTHPSLGLFLTVADALGEYKVRVEFQDENGVCLERLQNLTMTSTDRHAEGAIGLQGKNLLIPRPGTYFLKVFFNEEEIAADIRLLAQEIPSP